jgi:peptidoglycan/LPS O-acetylase OafA/YrhL
VQNQGVPTIQLENGARGLQTLRLRQQFQQVLVRPLIPSLTGLRFVAALCVVVSHAIPAIAPFRDPPQIVTLLSMLAEEGMSLFFVLSGFVIFYNYSETIGSLGGLRNFFVARFARLYPLYFVCLCYDLLLTVSYAGLPAAKIAIPLYLTLTQSWLYFPFPDHALIYQFGRIAQVTWSISTEWFFYFCFPVVCLLLPRSLPRLVWSAVGLIVVAITVIAALTVRSTDIFTFALNTFGQIGIDPQDSFYRWLMYFSPYTRLFEFVLGCLTAAIFVRLTTPPSTSEARYGNWAATGAIVCIAILHFGMLAVFDNSKWQVFVRSFHMNFGYAPFLAVLIFTCARYQNCLSAWLSTPTIILCGEVSYSIYLLHVVVIDGFRSGSSSIDTTWHIGLIVSVKIVVATIAIIGFSIVTWSLVEIPARRWIRRTFGRSALTVDARESK